MFQTDDIELRPAFTIERLDRRVLMSADAGVDEVIIDEPAGEGVVVCDRTIDWGSEESEGETYETLEMETFILTLGVDESGNEAAVCGFAELPAEEEVVYEAEILTFGGEGEELMYTCGFGELPIEEEAPVVDVDGEYDVEILVIDESAELVDPIDGYEVQILNVAPQGGEEQPAAEAFDVPADVTFASLDHVASSVLDSHNDDVLA